MGYTYHKRVSRWEVRYKKHYYGYYNTKQEAINALEQAKSGVPYKYKRRHARKDDDLPRNIYKTKSGLYQVKIMKNGKNYTKVLPTLESAKNYRDRLYKELNIKPIKERISWSELRQAALRRLQRTERNTEKISIKESDAKVD